MPRAKMAENQIQDEAEKLFLEQAKAYYRDLRAAAQNAPDGKIIAQEDTTKLKALETVDGYLTWHKTRLGYRERLWQGRAIGSGQVEGACKNLIGARLKQTGARWREDRVNRMGVVCSLFYTDQWDEYWQQAS